MHHIQVKSKFNSIEIKYVALMFIQGEINDYSIGTIDILANKS